MEEIKNQSQYERYTFLENSIANFLSDIGNGYCTELDFSSETIKELEEKESMLFSARKRWDEKRLKELKKR